MPTNQRSRPGLATAACLLALAAGTLAAEDDARPAAGGRLALFDGRTLDGWEATDFGGQGPVEVEDGAIVMATGRPMTGITSTRQDLPRSDYELRYEARRVEGSDFFAAATFPVGDAYITLVNGGWGGHVTGLSSIDGADASENETGIPLGYKDKRWYRFRVRVTANRIRAWVDEKTVVNVVIRDREVGTRVETRVNQPLGFATWMTSGALRAIDVRHLTPAEVAENNAIDL